MPLNFVRWSFGSKLASSLVGFAIVLAAGELALRRAGFVHPRGADRKVVWNPERDAQMRAGEGLYRFDPTCMWSPRPGAVIPGTDGERINPDGFRGPQLDLERTPGVLRIAAIGGAATLGVGVRWEDTYCARLVQILRELGVRCEILCAGAEDHSVVQGLERWRNVVRVWQPQLVICTYVGWPDHKQAPQERTDALRLAWCASGRASPRRAACATDCDCSTWRRTCATSPATSIGSSATRRSRSGVSQLRPGELDWPGQRRVPYDDYVDALTTLMSEIRSDKGRLDPALDPASAGLRPDAPAAEVYQRAAADAARLVGSALLDGRNALVRSVMEEEVAQGGHVPGRRWAVRVQPPRDRAGARGGDRGAGQGEAVGARGRTQHPGAGPWWRRSSAREPVKGAHAWRDALASALVQIALLVAFFWTPISRYEQVHYSAADLTQVMSLTRTRAGPPLGQPAAVGRGDADAALAALQPQRARGRPIPALEPAQRRGHSALRQLPVGRAVAVLVAVYVLDFKPALLVSAALKHFALGMFTYLFLRQIGCGWLPATTGAVAFQFAGHNALLLYFPHVGAAFALPAGLYFLERALQRTSAAIAEGRRARVFAPLCGLVRRSGSA
jgi:hypothetical protein